MIDTKARWCDFLSNNNISIWTSIWRRYTRRIHVKQMNSYKKTKATLSFSNHPGFSAMAIGGLLAATLVLGACAPRVDSRGNQVQAEDLVAIEPGIHTRGNVHDALGSPSSTSQFGIEIWYYISEMTETTAFLAPEVMERQVVAIKFDAGGIVTSVDILDEQQAQLVEPVAGETPTAGNTLGFIDQMISNFGRFNKK